ncbi:MAG: phosphatidylglycerophosphatase A [Acetobacteraceae bacterium]|nr:phosphatidylglycerophosphatase A [Acetobacteraceae bacterium]
MRLARIVAGGFGCGAAPVAPGTAASAAAALCGYALLLWPGYMLGLAALAAILAGLWAIRVARADGDPGWVVIDEVAGQWVTLLGLARPSLAGVLAGFVIFRLLDITKPGPVGWADRQPGAAGVMADDVVAGLISAAILWVARSRWPALFG